MNTSRHSLPRIPKDSSEPVAISIGKRHQIQPARWDYRDEFARFTRQQEVTDVAAVHGHLFPGQEADAVAAMREMLLDLLVPLQGTGTNNATATTPTGAQHRAQQLGRETLQPRATADDEATKPTAQTETRKALQIADLGDDLQLDAFGCESRPGGI